MAVSRADRRSELIRQIIEFLSQIIFGSLSAIYRTCGTPGCRCHRSGPKHGPHLQVVYRGASGKSTGYYVPKATETEIRQGVAAWKAVQEALRTLADLNRDEILERARNARTASHVAAGSRAASTRRRRLTHAAGPAGRP